MIIEAPSLGNVKTLSAVGGHMPQVGMGGIGFKVVIVTDGSPCLRIDRHLTGDEDIRAGACAQSVVGM